MLIKAYFRTVASPVSKGHTADASGCRKARNSVVCVMPPIHLPKHYLGSFCFSGTAFMAKFKRDDVILIKFVQRLQIFNMFFYLWSLAYKKYTPKLELLSF